MVFSVKKSDYNGSATNGGEGEFRNIARRDEIQIIGESYSSPPLSKYCAYARILVIHFHYTQ